MKPIRLLLADDHPVVRVGLRTLLETEPDLQVVGEAERGGEMDRIEASEGRRREFHCGAHDPVVDRDERDAADHRLGSGLVAADPSNRPHDLRPAQRAGDQ